MGYCDLKTIYLNEIKAIFTEDEIKLDENMANHTSFKTGGNADVYIETESLEKIQKYLNLDIVKDNKFVADKAGKYTVKYMVCDEAGNYAFASYTITVK